MKRKRIKWALGIATATGLLALAPFPQGIKIIGDIVFNERADHATTPAAGTGIIWVKNTTPSTPMFTDDGGTDYTLNSGGGGGSVDSVNGQTGAVTLDADDIDDTSTTNKFTTAAEASKLAGIESGATADQTDAEIETAYNNQVGVMSQATAETGTSTTPERVTALRIAQAIAAQAGGGGDPTYGSDAGASNDAVYVDASNNVGVGTTTPTGSIDIYRTDSPPMYLARYYNAGGSGSDEKFAGSGTSTGTGFSWGSPGNITADDNTIAAFDPSSDSESQYLVSSSHNIVVPDGAEVLGIEFTVAANYSAYDSHADGYDVHVYPVKGGTILTGTDLKSATQWPGTETARVYGGPTNLLGTTWTEAEVEAAGFGLAFKASVDADDTLHVDYIKAKVYFSTGTAGDYTWSVGADITNAGAWTLSDETGPLMTTDYTTGDTEFAGNVTAPYFYGSAQYMTDLPSGAVDSVNGQTGVVSLDADDIDDTSTTNKFTTSAEISKLAGIETGATADQSNAEIETAYNTQVSAMDQTTAETGTSTTVQRVTALRLRQAASATPLGFSGGDISGSGTVNSITATIVDDAVTTAKMSNAAEYTLLGRNTSGSGNRVDMTVADAMTMLGAAYADPPTNALSDGATVTIPYEPGVCKLHTVTVAGNRNIVTSGSTLALGNKLLLLITQDATGGRTCTFDTTYFKFASTLPSPTQVTTSNSSSLFLFMYLGGGKYTLVSYLLGI